jgi:phosphate transport system permease protein
MADAALAPAPPASEIVRPPRERISSWPVADQMGYWLSWLTAVGLCLIAFWIVAYMFVKGLSSFSFSLFVEPEQATITQATSGGFRDALIGTVIVATIGTAIAAPLGIGIAAWLTEYGRPAWLARAVDSSLEVIAGAPSIVLALFGLLVFAQSFLSFLSQEAPQGALGESFLVAGIVMTLIALPLIVASTREALVALPPRMREASYALGKTRITTIRRVLLPSVRPSIASGIVLGMGRIIGDTAIIAILLGGTLRNEPVGGTPVLSTLRGLGSTMTYYVYYNSPAGEGNSHEKAYVAAFVLLVLILGMNATVTWLTKPRGALDEKGSRRIRMTLTEWMNHIPGVGPWTR